MHEGYTTLHCNNLPVCCLSLSVQFVDHGFASLSGARIVRIATHPDLQGVSYLAHSIPSPFTLARLLSPSLPPSLSLSLSPSPSPPSPSLSPLSLSLSLSLSLPLSLLSLPLSLSLSLSLPPSLPPSLSLSLSSLLPPSLPPSLSLYQMGYGFQALKLLYSYYHGDMVCEDTPTDTSITSTDQQQVRLHISLKITDRNNHEMR